MTSISKNVYINTLADTVHEYNNTDHSTIIRHNNQRHILTLLIFNDKDPKLKVGDHVRISK